MSAELTLIIGIWVGVVITALALYGFRGYQCRGLHHCLCQIIKTCPIDECHHHHTCIPLAWDCYHTIDHNTYIGYWVKTWCNNRYEVQQCKTVIPLLSHCYHTDINYFHIALPVAMERIYLYHSIILSSSNSKLLRFGTSHWL